MSIKITHYAQPITTNVKTFIEASFIEFFIGLICAAFAYFIPIRIKFFPLQASLVNTFLSRVLHR
jgi:hypothetical protein